MLPASASATISDLLPNVQLILQNRTDILSYSPEKFMRKAILELTQAYPFEELRTAGPQQLLTVGQYQYPVTFFVNAGEDYRQLHALNIFVDPNTNTVAYPLHYDTPTAIQTLLFIPGGLPARWTRFGQNIWVGPQPNQMYTVFMVYQRAHPFNEQNIPSSPIYMPPEFLEAVEYATAYRLAAGPLRWSDMATQLRAMLYGDPNDTADVGLIKRLWSQQQLDERMHSRNFTMVVQR
jgi:hypothetical protein